MVDSLLNNCTISVPHRTDYQESSILSVVYLL